MLIEAILTFRSYSPKKLKKGMLFYLTADDKSFIYELDKTPKDQENTLKALGQPVLPYIVSLYGGKSHTLASYEQIGYICDEDGQTEEVTIEWFNSVLENEGKLMIEMDNNKPFLLEGKVVLSIKEEELCFSGYGL